MSADPVLVLQLHRMGDLVLTFPLLLRLRQLWPGHPLWVVAEPQFFMDIMPLAPEVVFFPPSHCGVLAQGRYAAAVNLSSSPVAADCLARLDAPQKLGAMTSATGLHIKGYWQLYRAALTQNNHNNAFHWADLHLLDLSPGLDLKPIPRMRPRQAGTGRVGLVLGASQAAKCPDADFWIRLVRRLARAGVPPVLLGGPAERELGAEVARQSGLAQANLCGRLRLGELAALMRTLDLCVTPDTGPMHLADFLGVPVLNLSMGPVHARETGPSSPGQWVLRAAMSCVGCWQCGRTTTYCKKAFSPMAVARTILRLLQADAPSPAAVSDVPRPLTLLRTGRDALGLYSLERIPADREDSCRPLLEDVWQAVFLFLYDSGQAALLQQRLARLHTAFPRLAQSLAAQLTRLCARCADQLKTRAPLPADFWRNQPPLLRLFAGHVHMFLQNTDYSPEGWHTTVQRLGALAPLFAALKSGKTCPDIRT